MSDVQIYGLDGALNSHATMTTEQILAAIQRAVTTGEVTDEFQAFIEMIVEQNKKIGIKFWLGTQDEFNALTKTESNTIYFVYTTVIKDISDGIQELYDGLLDGIIKVAAATNADGVVTHHVSGGTDLNNYRGSEYWGKRFYAGGSNSVVNLPYSNGAGFSLEIMRAGSYSTVQRLTSIIAGGSTAYPTVYTRSVVDTATEASGTWTEWQEVAEAKGTYPNMTVGNLVGTVIYDDEDGDGWSKSVRKTDILLKEGCRYVVKLKSNNKSGWTYCAEGIASKGAYGTPEASTYNIENAAHVDFSFVVERDNSLADTHIVVGYYTISSFEEVSSSGGDYRGIDARFDARHVSIGVEGCTSDNLNTFNIVKIVEYKDGI